MDSTYGRKSSTFKGRFSTGRSGSLAAFSPLSPVAEGAEGFKFDDVTVDLQLDRALSAIVSDDVNNVSGGVMRPQQQYLLGPVVRASLLHVACTHRAFRCAKFIAHLGATLDAQESYRQDTALHIAARLGELALTEIICGAGADLETKNMLEDTALHVAAGCGHVDVVRCLLAMGANHLAKNRFGDTPWDSAQKCGTSSAKICADLLYTHHCRLKEDSQM
ncbi:Ankyrin repeat-containing domain [Trinorchestia longiramus]|nr:Ankyrin repeat-containing domain [Trinorchestia longiramus]